MPADSRIRADAVQVCGGGHLDRHLWLQSEPIAGRTNPARQTVSTGGVAANIACHLAAFGATVKFIGVHPPEEAPAMAARLHDRGVAADIRPLAGEVPGYSAVMRADGELLIGAAALSLYEQVTEEMVTARLDPKTALVIDANFPEPVILAMVEAADASRRQFAAGTSVAKVGRLRAALSSLHALVLNRAEAASLVKAGGAPVDYLARELAGHLADGGVALVSDGGAQAALAGQEDADREQVVVMAPPQVAVVNANGAGDAMAASLFWGLMNAPGLPLDARLRTALAAGAAFASGAPLPDPVESL